MRLITFLGVFLALLLSDHPGSEMTAMANSTQGYETRVTSSSDATPGVFWFKENEGGGWRVESSYGPIVGSNGLRDYRTDDAGGAPSDLEITIDFDLAQYSPNTFTIPFSGATVPGARSGTEAITEASYRSTFNYTGGPAPSILDDQTVEAAPGEESFSASPSMVTIEVRETLPYTFTCSNPAS